MCDFARQNVYSAILGDSSNHPQPRRPQGFWHKIRQKMRFSTRMCLFRVTKPKFNIYTPFLQNCHFWARFCTDAITDVTAAALWGKICATQVLPMQVSPFAFRYQGKGATPCQLERQLIALQLCRWEVLHNETSQQTFRPLLCYELYACVQKTGSV